MQTFTNHLGISFVHIPAGHFQMGAVAGDEDAEWNERPAIPATVPRDFFLAVQPVTRGQFSHYLTLPEGEHCSTRNDQPANHLSAMDADGFVEALNASLPASEHQLVYVLPSESEWEYACRAGTTTRFYFGDDPGYQHLKQHAWYADNAWHMEMRSPQPCGTKGANPWGLQDMHGNVWEWTRDGWGLYEDIAQQGDAARDPALRVLRGGGWCHDARYLRASDRDHYALDYRHYYTGMRLAFHLR